MLILLGHLICAKSANVQRVEICSNFFNPKQDIMENGITSTVSAGSRISSGMPEAKWSKEGQTFFEEHVSAC